MEPEIVRCPHCWFEFDFNDGFWWGADMNNDPTVENMTCPYCGATTKEFPDMEKYGSHLYNYEDFEILDN